MPTIQELASGGTININDWFMSISQHVAESRRVIEELSKEDPPTEPFKSKYAGRNMLKSALQRAQDYNPFTNQEKSRVRLAQATLYYYMALTSADVEEPVEAEKYFKSSIEVLELEPVSKYNISLHLANHNVLATVWSGRGDHNKAFELLEKAKEVHADYIHSKQEPPHALDEVFMDEEFTAEERSTMFEKAYTNTLFYLAQVYGVRGDNQQAAAHCHITLQRQLEADDFDPLDWSLNCATLSQYYVTMNNYVTARHTLSCASSVMSNIEHGAAGAESNEEKESNESTYSEDNYDSEKVRKTRADIERCWIKYCVNLLKDSVVHKEESDVEDKLPRITEVKNSFEEEEDNKEKKEEEDKTEEVPDNDESKKEGEEEGKEEEKEEGKKDNENEDSSSENEEKKMKTFSDLVDLEDIELLRITNIETGQYEELVGDELCTTYEEARKIFKAGSKFADNSVNFYNFEEYVSDHVEIKRDLSTLYKGLTHFDKDESRQCKMHKRRIDLLTEMVTPLNTQHFLQLCRQLRFELGEARNQMVSLKLSIACELPPAEQNWKKINNLCYAAIQEFEHFIELLKDPSGNFPTVLAEETVKPYIVCQVYIARLYGKVRAIEPKQKIAFMAKALSHFQTACDYYDSHDIKHLDVLEEVNIAREMLTFLPIKMEKMKQMA